MTGGRMFCRIYADSKLTTNNDELPTRSTSVVSPVGDELSLRAEMSGKWIWVETSWRRDLRVDMGGDKLEKGYGCRQVGEEIWDALGPSRRGDGMLWDPAAEEI